MFLLGSQIQTDWVLGETPVALTVDDLGIITVEPYGSTTYANVITLSAPSVDKKGLVTHFFIPYTEGLWEVTLVKGTADNYTQLDKALFYVHTGETEILPTDYIDGSLVI